MLAVRAIDAVGTAGRFRGLSWLWAACCLTPLACAAQGLADSAAQAVADNAPRPRMEVELSKELPVGTPQLTEVLQTDAAAFERDQALRSRWWIHAGRVTLGAGADWPRGPHWSAPQPVLGLRTAVAANTLLSYEWHGHSASQDAPPGGRFVLEFRTAPSQIRTLRDGLLRMQLSGTSSLNLRPRRSGVLVTYSAQF
jgi:hypothetical protein